MTSIDATTVNLLLGIAIGVIGFFLKQAITELKEVKAMAIKSASELAVLKNDHKNKHESMGEKHEELKESIDKLTNKIDLLTNKIK